LVIMTLMFGIVYGLWAFALWLGSGWAYVILIACGGFLLKFAYDLGAGILRR
jgi:hypothetical protein